MVGSPPRSSRLTRIGRSTLAVATLMVAAIILASVAPPAQAQTKPRRPSLATTTPGVLMIWTAKGGDKPGCTCTVEYRTPPGSGTADGTVNVTLQNTGNEKSGDYYSFTTAELTPGAFYDFRVQHTADTDPPCMPNNVWSDWSSAFQFKPPENRQNIGAVSVTAKTATGRGDTTGSATMTVPRGGWIGLHFEPVTSGQVFPHGIFLETCMKKNEADVAATACSVFYESSQRFDIKRGASEAWLWFQVTKQSWAVGDFIFLRFRAVSANHTYWQWQSPDQYPTRNGASDPCQRVALGVTAAVGNSEQESEQPQQQQEQSAFVPDAALVAAVRSYAAETHHGAAHVERWRRSAWRRIRVFRR